MDPLYRPASPSPYAHWMSHHGQLGVLFRKASVSDIGSSLSGLKKWVKSKSKLVFETAYLILTWLGKLVKTKSKTRPNQVSCFQYKTSYWQFVRTNFSFLFLSAFAWLNGLSYTCFHLLVFFIWPSSTTTYSIIKNFNSKATQLTLPLGSIHWFCQNSGTYLKQKKILNSYS